MRKKIIAVALCCCLATPLAACGGGGGGGSKPSTDKNTINIKMRNSGWGSAWIEDVAAKFEAAYAEEGYKVNLLEPMATFQGNSALSEIRLGYEKTGYEIVISSGYTVQELTDAAYGVCVEPVTDVMQSKPIGFDGEEDAETITSLFGTNEDWRIKIDDTYWGVPYTSDVRGLVCNTKVLNKYGITELPTTTDELFEDFSIIYNGANGKKGMRPVVWGGDNAYGYALPSLYTAIAQLMGEDAYNEFFRMDNLLNADGTIKADGYEHVNNAAVKEALNITMHSFDTAYSLSGSLTQKHDKAHASIITGKAAFMFDGNFFYNEVSNSFPNYLNDVRFCLLPIASQLGVDLKLDGSGTDRKKCDDILSFMTKQVDAGKTAAEIKAAAEAQFTGISFKEEQVARVIEARKIGNGSTSYLNIMKGAPAEKVEISKLFIRMLLSEDAAEQVFSKYGMLSATYADVEVNNSNKFIIDSYQANSVVEYRTTSQLYPGSVRAKTNMFLVPPYNALFPVQVKDDMGIIENANTRDYAALTTTVFNKITSNVKDNWANLMEKGGYTLGS